jgi:hypothetical protein
MSESLKKLKEIPVVNKIMHELDLAVGVKDKVRYLPIQHYPPLSESLSHQALSDCGNK